MLCAYGWSLPWYHCIGFTRPRTKDFSRLSQTQIQGEMCGGTGMCVHPHAHSPQQKVFKHLVFVCKECKMQFQWVHSLNPYYQECFCLSMTLDFFSQLSQIWIWEKIHGIHMSEHHKIVTNTFICWEGCTIKVLKNSINHSVATSFARVHDPNNDIMCPSWPRISANPPTSGEISPAINVCVCIHMSKLLSKDVRCSLKGSMSSIIA